MIKIAKCCKKLLKIFGKYIAEIKTIFKNMHKIFEKYFYNQ